MPPCPGRGLLSEGCQLARRLLWYFSPLPSHSQTKSSMNPQHMLISPGWCTSLCLECHLPLYSTLSKITGNSEKQINNICWMLTLGQALLELKHHLLQEAFPDFTQHWDHLSKNLSLTWWGGPRVMALHSISEYLGSFPEMTPKVWVDVVASTFLTNTLAYRAPWTSTSPEPQRLMVTVLSQHPSC